MIFNVTYTNKETVRTINSIVGKPYGLITNLKKRGIGSQPLSILEVNDQLREYTGAITNMSKCNIELRPNGIIIYFSRKLINFAWPIPYYHLTVFQNRDVTSLFHNTDFIKLKPKASINSGLKFVQKMLKEKNQFLANGQLSI